MKHSDPVPRIAEAHPIQLPRGLARYFRDMCDQTLAFAEPWSSEDGALQSMPDASPVIWHLGHTSWFCSGLRLARDGAAA